MTLENRGNMQQETKIAQNDLTRLLDSQLRGTAISFGGPPRHSLPIREPWKDTL